MGYFEFDVELQLVDLDIIIFTGSVTLETRPLLVRTFCALIGSTWSTQTSLHTGHALNGKTVARS
jgi:hypothetical protein